MCRSLGNPQHFQILSFNVEGFKTKLDEPSFLDRNMEGRCPKN